MLSPIKRQMPYTIEDLAKELLLANPKVHLNHLLVTGPSSFAAHKAMDQFYKDVVDLVDDVVEEYQGATEQLMMIQPGADFPIMRTAEDCLNYLRTLRRNVTNIQLGLSPELSNISNILDEVKSAIDSAKYKLIFLK